MSPHHPPHNLWSDGKGNSTTCTGVPENLKSPDYDLVNHPPHYNSHPSGIECITVVRHMNFNVGNAVKYLWRCGLKDEDTRIQDLEKAAWYIQNEIERLSTC